METTHLSIAQIWTAIWLGLIFTTVCSAEVPSSGDATIQRRAGESEIVIRTTTRLAGAIHSLSWNGREFIDSSDHGRQLQSASNFDAGTPIIAETFNPTEAGSRRDGAGPRSSSRLLQLIATDHQLQTTSQMAFWLAPDEKSEGNAAKNTTVLSNHLLTKRVLIGYRNLEQVIQYDVTFGVPIGEDHTSAVFEALTGYMPADFELFWRFDLSENELQPLDDGPGEQPFPVVMSTNDKMYAMGIYAPQAPLLGFGQAGYGRFRFRNEKVVKWNCVFRRTDAMGIVAADYNFRCFVIVGNLATVTRLIGELNQEFFVSHGKKRP